MSQAPVSSDITSDDKLWAGLGYLFWPIAAIMLLIDEKKARRFIKYHAVQSLALTVVLIVLAIILGCILGALTFFLAGAGGVIGSFVFLIAIWPAIEAFMGRYVELPFVTNFIKKQGWV